ncbi:hypothetical protein [uncultured Bacteroides sp.]|uniref:hypothetical protein n=1 Tax=uncultured Bacteroides sp. TaxID=162156 RepID=UPI002AABEB78|nr:hypothetical protein [uncultured Bacteroides sp.]
MESKKTMSQSEEAQINVTYGELKDLLKTLIKTKLSYNQISTRLKRQGVTSGQDSEEDFNNYIENSVDDVSYLISSKIRYDFSKSGVITSEHDLTQKMFLENIAPELYSIISNLSLEREKYKDAYSEMEENSFEVGVSDFNEFVNNINDNIFNVAIMISGKFVAEIIKEVSDEQE